MRNDGSEKISLRHRIIGIGHFVAVSSCARLLADLGADIIKIEPPSDDSIREWGQQVNSASLRWSITKAPSLSL